MQIKGIDQKGIRLLNAHGKTELILWNKIQGHELLGCQQSFQLGVHAGVALVREMQSAPLNPHLLYVFK